MVWVLSRFRAPASPSLSSVERQAVRRFRGNHELEILPADKGNAPVLLGRTNYSRKMLTLIQDTNTYVPLDCDPTPKVQKDFQRLMADVFRVVPPERKSMYFTLLCRNGSAPALYGLPQSPQARRSHAPNCGFYTLTPAQAIRI
ncbi:hypothetical protein HPB51_016291 [Rhipicephalus microplus]|uniref:Uncharacterized protein n=1 Tax=Rhipicephalus microplus TaxID=6941 RepID=A0A9J6DA24_RHIMP|nr:hypothetical protein HPB51_016291 [Rhipicephalus microplus]